MLSLALAFRERRKAGAIVTLQTKRDTHTDKHKEQTQVWVIIKHILRQRKKMDDSSRGAKKKKSHLTSLVLRLISSPCSREREQSKRGSSTHPRWGGQQMVQTLKDSWTQETKESQVRSLFMSRGLQNKWLLGLSLYHKREKLTTHTENTIQTPSKTKDYPGLF